MVRYSPCLRGYVCALSFSMMGCGGASGPAAGVEVDAQIKQQVSEQAQKQPAGKNNKAANLTSAGTGESTAYLD
jgi:hypothetical protein